MFPHLFPASVSFKLQIAPPAFSADAFLTYPMEKRTQAGNAPHAAGYHNRPGVTNAEPGNGLRTGFP